MGITRDFTVSVIIVRKEKALLHLHKKMDKWLPIGGHIERDELPEKAALREVREESGLETILYNLNEQVDMADARQLIYTAVDYWTGDKDINGVVLEVSGRYPDKNRVVNLECKEMAYIIKGLGKIVIEGEETQPLWTKVHRLDGTESPVLN